MGSPDMGYPICKKGFKYLSFHSLPHFHPLSLSHTLSNNKLISQSLSISLLLSPFGLNVIHGVYRKWDAPFEKIAVSIPFSLYTKPFLSISLSITHTLRLVLMEHMWLPGYGMHYLKKKFRVACLLFLSLSLPLSLSLSLFPLSPSLFLLFFISLSSAFFRTRITSVYLLVYMTCTNEP
jgi:hypothetical protein